MLTIDLNVGVPKPFTASGTPSPNGVLRTEAGAFIITEAGNFLAF